MQRSLPAPIFEPDTISAVHGFLQKDGRPPAYFATFGFAHPEDLDCTAATARLYCCWAAYREDPHNGFRMLDLAHCLAHEVGDLCAAEEIYLTIERLGSPGLDPTAHDEAPLFYLGWLYADRERHDEALACYEVYLATLARRGETADNEGVALIHYHIGSLYHEVEMWCEAEEAYARAIAAIVGPWRSRSEVSDEAFERFFGVDSLREVEAQRQRARRCLEFAGRRGCQIAPDACAVG